MEVILLLISIIKQQQQLQTNSSLTTIRVLLEVYFSWDTVCYKGWGTRE